MQSVDWTAPAMFWATVAVALISAGAALFNFLVFRTQIARYGAREEHCRRPMLASGAIAIGHPLGSSGARLATTLIHEMARTGASRGIASLCVGVGQGLATVFERE